MDIKQIMKQAQAMQSKMAELQKTMADTTVEGSSGGGLVKVICSCKGKLKSIFLDDSLLVPSEKEILEDLIVTAMNNAEKNSELEMEKATTALGIPKDVLNSLS